MSITRTPIHDDDGTGTTGTILNNAWKQELYNQIDALALSGGGFDRQNVSTPGNVVLASTSSTHVLYLLPPAGTSMAITWSGGSGFDGERVVLFGYSGGWTIVAHGASSILNIATSAPTPIAVQGAAIYTKVSGVWYLTSHEQGAWITAPFSAGDFAAPGGGTWTVTAGQRTNLSYRLSGRTLSVNVGINGTTVGGTPATDLTIAGTQWGSFQIAANVYNNIARTVDGSGTQVQGIFVVNTGNANLRCLKENFAAWTAGAQASLVGKCDFEII